MPSKDDGRGGHEESHSRKYMPAGSSFKSLEENRGYVVENGCNSDPQEQEEVVYFDFKLNDADFEFRPKVERPPPKMTAVTREILQMQGDSRISILDALVKYYTINKPTDFEWKKRRTDDVKRNVIINKYSRKTNSNNKQTSNSDNNSVNDSFESKRACDLTNKLNDSSSSVSVSDMSHDSDVLESTANVTQSESNPAENASSVPTDNFGVIQKYTRKSFTKNNVTTENPLNDSLNVTSTCQNSCDSPQTLHSSKNYDENSHVSNSINVNDDVEQTNGPVIQRYTRKKISSSLSVASENGCRSIPNTSTCQNSCDSPQTSRSSKNYDENSHVSNSINVNDDVEQTNGPVIQRYTRKKISSSLSVASENGCRSIPNTTSRNIKLNFLSKQLGKTLENEKHSKSSALSHHENKFEAGCSQNVTKPRDVKLSFLSKQLRKPTLYNEKHNQSSDLTQHENKSEAKCSQNVIYTKTSSTSSSASENVCRSDCDTKARDVKLKFLSKQLRKTTSENEKHIESSALSHNKNTSEAECSQNVTDSKLKFLKMSLGRNIECKNLSADKSKLRFYKSMM